MNIEEITSYMKKKGQSKASIERTLWAMNSFESWLKSYRNCSLLETVTADDLRTFVNSNKKHAKELLLGLAHLFDFLGNEPLKTDALELRREMIDKVKKPMLLKEFIGVNRILLQRLEEMNIRNALDLISVSRTHAARKALATALGVTYSDLLDLVKMADLSRLFAVKAVRARLYLESGLDTLDKLAIQEAKGLHEAMVQFVTESQFNGIPTLPKEAEGTIAEAKKLERLIDFEKDE